MPDILHRVGVNNRVYRVLTTIGGLRTWWISGTTGVASIGGPIDFGFCQMRVDELVPDKTVRWTCVSGPEEWVGTHVMFDLTWRNGETSIPET